MDQFVALALLGISEENPMREHIIEAHRTTKQIYDSSQFQELQAIDEARDALIADCDRRERYLAKQNGERSTGKAVGVWFASCVIMYAIAQVMLSASGLSMVTIHMALPGTRLGYLLAGLTPLAQLVISVVIAVRWTKGELSGSNTSRWWSIAISAGLAISLLLMFTLQTLR